MTLQQRTTTQDAYGAPVETWSDLATVWGHVEPLSGREYFQAQQLQARVNTHITIRYRDGVTPLLRAKLGSRVYRIEAVINPDERKRELQLMCEEEVT